MINYHVQMATYLNLYGTVKGLAIISAQFGHISPWFTISASLEEILKIYSGIIVGGFTLFLSFFQILISIEKVLNDKYEIFLFIYFSMSIPYLYIHVQPTSVENGLNIAIGFAFFHAIKYLNELQNTCIETKSLSPPENQGHFWLAIILSSSCLSLKLTGLPMLVLAGLLVVHFLYNQKPVALTYHFILRLFLLFLVFGLSRFVSASVVSGCPLYPSHLFHLSVSWFVGKDFSNQLIAYMINHARWNSEFPPNDQSFYNWFNTWSNSYGGKTILYLFSLLFLYAGISFCFFRKSFFPGILKYKILIIAQIFGILYIMLTAPSSRFIPPYIVGLLTTLMIINVNHEIRKILISIAICLALSNFFAASLLTIIAYFLLSVLILSTKYLTTGVFIDYTLVSTCLIKVISVIFYFLPISFSIPTNPHPLLVPDISSFERSFSKKEINGINFYMPGQHYGCGYAQLPCITNYRLHFEITPEKIELIDKQKGIAGGFKIKVQPQAQ